jgi:2-isopropylmalate synthase
MELDKYYPALAEMRLGTFTVAALDVRAQDSAAHVRVTVSFTADGHEPPCEPWTTSGISSDLNQAALMAIVDGFHYWLLLQNGNAGQPGKPVPQAAAQPVSGLVR